MPNFLDDVETVDNTARSIALFNSYGRRTPGKMPKHYYDIARLGPEPSWFRFIKGAYPTKVYVQEQDEHITVSLPFFKYTRHYDQSCKKFFPCSAGDSPETDPKPCVGCSKGLSPQDVVAYTVVHLAWYHEVPWVKDGVVQINKATNQPMTNLTLCEETNCPMCRTPNGPKRVFGRRQHLALNYSQRNLLGVMEDRLRMTCRCKEPLEVTALKCPKCGTRLLDLETTECTKSQIIAYRREGMICSKCGRKMRMIDELACGCGDPRPLSIYDVDTQLTKIVTSEKSSTLLVEFSPPGLIDAKYKGSQEPYNFAEVFAPPSIETQRMLTGYRGPITNAAEGSASEPYSAGR